MPKHKNFLAGLWFFLFGAVVSAVVFPAAAKAQAVGSHLGEGDIGGQINNIQILQQNGAGSGFPVTVMLNINMAGQDQQAMHNLATAVKEAGFLPIVRLTHVCSAFESGVTPSNAVQNAKNAFGTNALIVYGNEVNNREAECPNWTKYVSDYNSIADKTNVSPAALDYYMGNPAYTVETFFNSTPGAREIYESSTINAANAYECVGISGQNAVVCESPWETNTMALGYQAYSGQIFLTEFSLSPEGRVPNSPDTDLQKVVQFIQEKAADTGASLITPLVRNVCNNEGEWLLYINGRLLTIVGTDVTENCEGRAGVGEGYDLSDFPDYGYNQSYYYLHPIKGIHPDNSPGGRRVSITRADLASQGYEAYCAAEPTTIKLDVNTRDLINRFLASNPTGVSAARDSTYVLDSSGGQFPLFRDTTGKKYLTTSIEEYFGFKDIYTDDGYSVMELNTAPINTLLSQEQKCIQGVDILRNIQLMCERLEDSANCALLENQIPGTNYNVSTLLDDVKKVIPGYRAGKIAEQCKMLFSDKIPEFAMEDPELPVFKKAITNVPLNIDRSFRLAFLVASIEQRPQTSAFNFFAFSNLAAPRHEVLVVAFKIPDILTNKGGGETAGHHFFNDSATLTRDALVPSNFRFSESDEAPGYDRQTRDRRTAVGQNAANAAAQNQDSTIYCVNSAADDPDQLASAEGSAACKDILGKAVVDLINGNTPSCNNMQSEPVLEVLQAANIIPPDLNDGSRLFNPDYDFGNDVLNYIFTQNLTPQRDESTFTSIFNIVGNAFDNAENETTAVDFFLVYPVGYELDSVTEVLKNTFFTAHQIAELEASTNRQRFNARGFASALSGATFSHTFNELPSSGNCTENTVTITEDPVTGAPIIPPQVITVYNCEQTFDVAVQEDGQGGLSVLGANLGFWMRNIQRTLNGHFSAASAYIASCATTEEFLLGRCAGRALASPPGSNLGGSEIVSPLCGRDYPIKADDIVPDYYSQTILNRSSAAYNTQVPSTPDVGRAMYYAAGVMNRVLQNRIAWKQIPAGTVSDCEGGDSKYRGCVALLRAGDMGREVYLKRPGQNAEGPYLVIDVAAEHDIACLLERNWIVDVDWGTAQRWGMKGPVDAQICETAACP